MTPLYKNILSFLKTTPLYHHVACPGHGHGEDCAAHHMGQAGERRADLHRP